MRSFIFYSLRQVQLDPSSKEDEMGRPYSTNGEEGCIEDIGDKARRKEITRKTKICVGG
jgi:hypothetical protein